MTGIPHAELAFYEKKRKRMRKEDLSPGGESLPLGFPKQTSLNKLSVESGAFYEVMSK